MSTFDTYLTPDGQLTVAQATVLRVMRRANRVERDIIAAVEGVDEVDPWDERAIFAMLTRCLASDPAHVLDVRAEVLRECAAASRDPLMVAHFGAGAEFAEWQAANIRRANDPMWPLEREAWFDRIQAKQRATRHGIWREDREKAGALVAATAWQLRPVLFLGALSVYLPLVSSHAAATLIDWARRLRLACYLSWVRLTPFLDRAPAG